MSDTLAQTELAILGGPPLSATTLHVGRPNVLDRARLLELINGAIDRGWLSNDGPLVQEFEARFAEFTHVKHAIAVANATFGLQLVAVALGLRGDVVMPSFTFVGTAHALAWIGLRPVFADVSPLTHTLDPAEVEACLTTETSAILGVHLWGGPCDVDGLQQVADRHGLALFFDAAHAVGTTYRGQSVGGFGRAEVFSFHATKAINALEAGMITTNDDALAPHLRLLRNYGFVEEDTVVGLGINAKLNEFAAAMGLSNLESFDRIRTHNHRLHDAYRAGLADAPGLTLRLIEESGSAHYAVLELDDASQLERDELHHVLRAENILVRRYFRPGCHRSLPYSAVAPPRPLPVTERLSRRLLQLPTGLQLEPELAQRIGAAIRSAAGRAPQVRQAIAERVASP